MSYTITVGNRCEVSDLIGVRCVLLAGHRNLHSRADGQRFSQPGGPLLFEGGSFSDWAYTRPSFASPGVPVSTRAQVGAYVQSLTAKFRAEAFQRDLVTGQQLHDSCRAERRHTDTRADAHLRRIKALEQKITSLEHDVAAAVSPGYVDSMAARVAKLEEQGRAPVAHQHQVRPGVQAAGHAGEEPAGIHRRQGGQAADHTWAELIGVHRPAADFPWKVKTDAEQ